MSAGSPNGQTPVTPASADSPGRPAKSILKKTQGSSPGSPNQGPRPILKKADGSSLVSRNTNAQRDDQFDLRNEIENKLDDFTNEQLDDMINEIENK